MDGGGVNMVLNTSLKVLKFEQVVIFIIIIIFWCSLRDIYNPHVLGPQLKIEKN